MDEIEQNIRNLTNEELIQIVKTDYEQYTEDALRIASDELTRRNFTERELNAVCDDFSEDSGESEQPSGDCSAFLVGELQYQESFDAILAFVTNMSIRSGEYEGNKTVFKKMDRENFILYTEVLKANGRAIMECMAIHKDELISRMNEIARMNGFELDDEEV